MKKVILNFLIAATYILFNTKNIYANNNEKYVLVNLEANREDIGMPEIYFYGYSFLKEDNKMIRKIKYLTKNECSEFSNKSIEAYYKTINKQIADKKAPTFAIKNYALIGSFPMSANNFFCIPAKLWNKMKPEYTKEDELYDKYDEDLYKTPESFFKIMKQCGLTDFNYNHINLHDTPFICDKYSEKKPIPYTTYDNIVSEKKK